MTADLGAAGPGTADPVPAGETVPPQDRPALRLPVGARTARVVLLAAVFLCAACGLVYELALITLGQYLVGGTVTQTSLVIGVFVCAMGLGSFASKPLLPRAAAGFAVVELALALTGGLSVLGLYAAYSWLDLYTPALIATSVVVGGLIGAEIPLLMALLQRIRTQDAGEAAADLFAVDYVGALAGGLAFPFLLLPVFGQVRGAVVVAAVNLAAAVVLVVLLRDALSPRARRAVTAGAVLVAVVLAVAGLGAGRFLVSARQALYDDPVVVAERSAYQEIVVTSARGRDDVRLFLDGDLQFSSTDERRYHEALVHPAVRPGARRVLVLGGGDGLAAREVLRHASVERVVEVELDPQVLRLARTDPRLVRANGGALDDPRVEVVVDDALRWLRARAADGGEQFDAVVVDLPDPETPATAGLYSQEFYGLAARALAPGGRMVVQAGSPWFAPEAFWCIDATVAAAGLRTTTYHVDVPSFGDWGFVLAAREAAPVPTLDPEVQRSLTFLDADVLAAATVFPRDRARERYDVAVSTLDRPRILQYEARGWRGY